MKILVVFRSIILYSLWFIVCSFFIVASLMLNALGLRTYIYALNTHWSRAMLAISGLRFHYTFESHPEKIFEYPSIVIANHSSTLDIPLVDLLVAHKPRFWISNAKFTFIPFFGRILQGNHITISPNQMRNAFKALDQAAERASKSNEHIMMFPDGTRHLDGKIHPFKSGFAYLAQKLQRPIIPICIQGMGHCSPLKKFLLYPLHTPIRVIIGSPIKSLPNESKKDLVDRLERWFKLNHR